MMAVIPVSVTTGVGFDVLVLDKISSLEYLTARVRPVL
jgi:hypothetical protein